LVATGNWDLDKFVQEMMAGGSPAKRASILGGGAKAGSPNRLMAG